MQLSCFGGYSLDWAESWAMAGMPAEELGAAWPMWWAAGLEGSTLAPLTCQLSDKETDWKPKTATVIQF